MAWKSYALGKVNLATASTAAAEIITEKLGNCVVDTSARTYTYTYGGKTYTGATTSPYPSNTYDYLLCLNDATGEFVVSVATASLTGNTGCYYIAASMLRVKVDKNTEELSPNDLLNMGYEKCINILFSVNSTAFTTLVPAMTVRYYSSNENHYFRPIVDMFVTASSSVVPGQTIEVDGQQFMCVATCLYAKL